jgi:hypothetical protein
MECRERKLHLRFDTARVYDAEVRRPFDDVLQERALADAGIPPYHQRAALAVPNSIEEIFECATLLRATD